MLADVLQLANEEHVDHAEDCDKGENVACCLERRVLQLQCLLLQGFLLRCDSADQGDERPHYAHDHVREEALNGEPLERAPVAVLVPLGFILRIGVRQHVQPKNRSPAHEDATQVAEGEDGAKLKEIGQLQVRFIGGVLKELDFLPGRSAHSVSLAGQHVLRVGRCRHDGPLAQSGPLRHDHKDERGEENIENHVQAHVCAPVVLVRPAEQLQPT
mmetsp:Transcript_76190/g.176757  ORF Transcript_76190/g.176757 Transcript_76190/m.176757 type:complete len:215 (+) Transcript_76190:496-1140(+)